MWDKGKALEFLLESLGTCVTTKQSPPPAPPRPCLFRPCRPQLLLSFRLQFLFSTCARITPPVQTNRCWLMLMTRTRRLFIFSGCCRSPGFASCSDALPVYIGDDRTDEDAFKVLRKRGQGVGILVSKCPKETNASYSLQDPGEVMDFLLRLVEWKRKSSTTTTTRPPV
jgi:hypothetical protein